MEQYIALKHFFNDEFPEILNDWDSVQKLFQYKAITSKTVLLHEGDVADNVYFIKKGLLRLWNNDDGKEINMQFFFENQVVASLESFYNDKPSAFTIESIEDTELYVLTRKNLVILERKYSNINDYVMKMVLKRFIDYSKYFLSRIKNSPEQRFLELKQDYPQIIKRVPDHHIATYLGITPVSLCRIKQRAKKTEN